MSGNHAREGTYQPGALIYVDQATVTGGDFTTTTKSSYVDVTGLSISYTPPVDAWCYIDCRLRNKNDTAAIGHIGQIQVNSTGISGADQKMASANIYYNMVLSHRYQMTGGTAYTIKARIVQSDGGGAQTLTIDDDNDYTFLTIYVWKKP